MSVTPQGNPSATTPTPEKKVAIVFANLKGNVGDYAILEAMTQDLGTAFPGHRIVVYPHPLVPVDHAYLDEFRRLNPDIQFGDATYSMPIGLVKRLLSSSFLRRKAQASLINEFAAKSAADFRHFAGYSAVFFAGGDQWSGRELGVAMFGSLLAIHRVNDRVHSFPFSLKSSLLGLYTKADLTRYFALLRPSLIVRDSLTKEIIDQFSKNALLGADCVFSLNQTADEIRPNPERNPGRILFVVKGQEAELSETLEKLLGQQKNVELFTTCPPEDHRTYTKLAERFNLPYHEPKSWQEIIAEFKASELVITNRLHGLILGSLAQTPLLPVANRKKSLAYVRDANIPHCAMTPLEVTPDLIGKARADKQIILDRMMAYAENCRKLPYSPVRTSN